MLWEADGFAWFGLLGEPRDDVVALDALEQRFWLDVWHAPDLDAIEEMRIESRWYGPLLAVAVSTFPDEPMLNLILGAATSGAVEDGHLDAALDWAESLGLSCRIPITSGRGGTGAAEDLLNRRGYRRSGYQARFVRNAEPPDFPQPPGIEVDALEDFAEGFSELITEGFGMPLVAGCLFDCLPGRNYWHTYFGVDERERCVAAGMMMRHYDIAQLGFMSTERAARRKGCYTALVRRCILDAAATNCQLIVAETYESHGEGEGGELSAAARTLLRAGFEQVATRAVWQVDDGADEDDDEYEEDEGPEGIDFGPEPELDEEDR